MSRARSVLSAVSHRRLLLPLALALPLLPGCDAQSQIHGAEACLPGERGFLQASLRGALNDQLDWRGAQLQCEGGARPDGRGVRLSFAGPLGAGRRLRIVFGVAAAAGTRELHTLPVNVTAIIENEQRIYATLGDDKCTVETLRQELLPTLSATGSSALPTREYRIAARGFCVTPAATLDGTERLYIDRFDFAGRARFEESELHDTQSSPAL